MTRIIIISLYSVYCHQYEIRFLAAAEAVKVCSSCTHPTSMSLYFISESYLIL
jgi:hypothetical protein